MSAEELKAIAGTFEETDPRRRRLLRIASEWRDDVERCACGRPLSTCIGCGGRRCYTCDLPGTSPCDPLTPEEIQ